MIVRVNTLGNKLRRKKYLNRSKTKKKKKKKKKKKSPYCFEYVIKKKESAIRKESHAFTGHNPCLSEEIDISQQSHPFNKRVKKRLILEYNSEATRKSAIRGNDSNILMNAPLTKQFKERNSQITLYIIRARSAQIEEFYLT